MSEEKPAEAPAAADAPPAEGEEPAEDQEAEVEELKPACIDLTDYKLKIDHFDQMHVLSDESKLDGAENFRQVAGFPVFGTAQPTEEGFLKVLDTDQTQTLKIHKDSTF